MRVWSFVDVFEDLLKPWYLSCERNTLGNTLEIELRRVRCSPPPPSTLSHMHTYTHTHTNTHTVTKTHTETYTRMTYRYKCIHVSIHTLLATASSFTRVHTYRSHTGTHADIPAQPPCAAALYVLLVSCIHAHTTYSTCIHAQSLTRL